MKIPYVVVIGEKEINGGELNLRIRKDLEVEASGRTYNTEELLKSVANETKTRTSRSTL
jgi:threonyl-tRNA synthetase